MRVLFSPNISPQHLYPMVPLAWALRAAGHEVRVAANPGMADSIVHTGLPAVVVGTDQVRTGADDAGVRQLMFRDLQFPANWPLHPHLLNDDQRASIELLGQRAAMLAENTVDELIAFGRSWRPDIVVHDIGSFAGAVTAAALGVPGVQHLTGVGLRPMNTRAASPEPLPEFAALFERRGLPVRMPAVSIDPSPPSLRLPVSGPCRGVRYVPYNGPGAVPTWLTERPDRPRICVTWGISVLNVREPHFDQALRPFRLAVAALSDVDAEVVLTTTGKQLGLLGELPGNVRPVRSLPLHLALPYCDLLVHQAGDGTALTASACGIAQLAITRKPDPTLTGGRLAATGVAIHLRYQHLEHDPHAREVVRAAVEKLLADAAYTEAAVELREEIERQPAPAALVPVLEAIAGGGG
jgi:UDP:flavonoid glycosyltransferase YjiC (YdhE family)